ncbi:exodeoxyribonuclease V subunit alpha [Vibrio salinus]|uniref:exodeoxyribonuclease V subunit alpha n=1 Tax=Vibrio salinus TaxID=2899784 RepID=UPI001E53A03F|nr:exodeoxyribonuclease V subunit alpha [Vibrio salinus]MCE0494336.1 exodeoxyribonuclease V subunit alpha [Vibrio salinus]
MITELLDNLLKQKIIRPLDVQFAKFICQQSSGSLAPYVSWLAAVVSYELGHGHICFSLVDDDSKKVNNVFPFPVSLEGIETVVECLKQVDWLTLIHDSPAVGQPGDNTPLIFDGKRLYLHRYWFYEASLADKLLQFNQKNGLSVLDIHGLRESLDRLFPRSYSYLFELLQQADKNNDNQIRRLICENLDIVKQERVDWVAIKDVVLGATRAEDLQVLDELIPESVVLNWQKVAAAIAISQSFAVISGGPGTGKTTTVAKLLAALIEASSEQQPVIKLVAPTGKAAARLTESIGKAIDRLPVSPGIRERIPTQAGTIHRLLGAFPDRANFRHNKANLLHLDILIVDEASMVDLSLMYKLFDALPPHAKVILLGDKDQLASVEAGAVLGDICSFQAYGYSSKQASVVEKLTGFSASVVQGQVLSPPIADSLCVLQKSYRFSARSGIGLLAKAVNSGDENAVRTVLDSGYHDVHFFNLSAANYQLILSTLMEKYQAYLTIILDEKAGYEDTGIRAKHALRAFSQCRLLCAVRDGDFGVNGINERVERRLSVQKRICIQDDLWYEGRPIMIVRNDHRLGIYNGDIGLCMRDDDKRLKVFFEMADGTVKGILPSRLPLHETAYAMTVHKSQGSEFETTILVLPPDFTPVITRELIYTGITRAKENLYLLGNWGVFNRGTKLLTSRASGLADRLS